MPISPYFKLCSHLQGVLINPIMFTFIAHFQVAKTLGKGVVMQSLAGTLSVTSDIAEGDTRCLWWYKDTRRFWLWGNPLDVYQLLHCLLQI